MPLKGTGVLAIWNGIADGMDEEFLEWHVKEHIPERVAVPGFLRGRRYAAIDGEPAYCNFYEVSEPEVLFSQAYLERLNAPSEWTRRVVTSFVDTSRTICRVEHSEGIGEGAFVEALRFRPFDTGDTDREKRAALLQRLLEQHGVIGVHVLVRSDKPVVETSESKLRSRPDTTWDAIVLVEAVAEDAIHHLRNEALSDASLARSGLAVPAGRGLYRLEYALDRADLKEDA